MNIVAWAVIGLLAGGIARIVTGAEKRGCLATMAVGLIGSFIAGWFAQRRWHEGLKDFGIRSILLSALGAIFLLFVLQALGIVSRRGRDRPIFHDDRRRRW